MRFPKSLHIAASCVALLFASATQASEGCSRRELRARDTVTIELDAMKPGVREKPAFYLRDPKHMRVLFFRPEDVVATLDEQITAYQARYPTVTFAKSDRPIDWIREDLPLQQDTDLFKYVQRDMKFEDELNYLVAAILDKGQVAVDFDNDKHDPAIIKRVSWKTRDDEGRKYCDPEGREIYSVVDAIIVNSR